MNKIEQLLQRHCPNGVEWQPLGEVAEIYGGLTNKIKHDFGIGETYFIPYKNVFDNIEVQHGKLERVRIEKNEKQHKVRYGDVLFTGSSETPDEVGMSSVVTTRFQKPIYLNSFCFGVRFNAEIRLIPEFSKFLFRSPIMRHQIRKTASGVTRFNISKERFKKILIPLPPLAVQEEIVRILDTFTTLEAELELRKKQYEYYRDSLLTMKITVETYTLKDLFDTRNGYTPSTSNPDFWENGTIPWFVMEDIRENGRILSESKQHITNKAVKKSGLFPANSIIVATSATIGEHALITTDFLCNQRFTCLSPKAEYKNKIDIKYIFYYAFKLDEFCKNNMTKSSFSSVDMSKFYDFEFPLPHFPNKNA